MSVGSIGQLVLTNVFGAIAACFFVYRFIPIDKVLFIALVFFCGNFLPFFSGFLL
jgi:hypothetical protein